MRFNCYGHHELAHLDLPTRCLSSCTRSESNRLKIYFFLQDNDYLDNYFDNGEGYEQDSDEYEEGPTY